MKSILMGLALAACAATAAFAQASAPGSATPFRIQRGTAIAPPGVAVNTGQTAPPEGVGPGGINFAQWKSADPSLYGPAFEAQMRQRYSARTAADARADLEANGFSCAQSTVMQCRIEIMDQGCAKDWYVVFEPRRSEPVAGFDSMCLGARR
ncbi:MAG: hypothetical protein ABW199_12070 [Caulobacterales bacterium]